MIYVNDKRIQDLTEHFPVFKAKVAELQKKYPNTLSIVRNKKAQIYDITDAAGNPIGRRAVEDTAFFVPLKYSKPDDSGFSNTWYYSKSACKIEDGEVILPPTGRNVVITGKLIIDMKKDADLAFYLVHISPFVANGTFYIQDYEKEAEAELEKISGNSSLDFYLTSEDSPIHGDNEALVILAQSWGIQNAEKLSPAMLKMSIRNTVLVSEANKTTTKRGIKEFCHETKLGSIVKLRAKVQAAVDEGYIKFSVTDGGWFYSNEWYEGQQIIKCASPDIELLHKAAKDNPQVWQRIKGMFEKPGSYPLGTSDSNDLLPDIETIKEQLKQANIHIIGKSKEALIEMWKKHKESNQ